MAGLGQSSVEISKVAEAIKWIALQTNLLASTPRSRRPGPARRARGFAVVAHEIKELAAETARATTDVDAKVTAIQEQVGARGHRARRDQHRRGEHQRDRRA